MLDIVAILLVLTAAFSYLNHKYLKWPMTIGVMAIAMAVSLAVIAFDQLGFSSPRGRELELLGSIDFTQVLMEGLLSFLLFAGALHVDVGRLRRLAWQVGALAIVGTALSTVIVGYASWLAIGALGIDLPLAWCLLFGALISPTDPIAVLGVLRSANVPESVETTIAGESLINDGVGVVLFALILEMLHDGAAPTASTAFTLFAREALGGAAFGVLAGYLVFWLLRTIDAPEVEVLITLATVVGGAALAHELHVSGPLAMVAIGLIIGNQGRAHAMSERTRALLDVFWRLLDEILNGVLFVLIGLEFAVIAFPPGSLLAAVFVVALCLLSRYLVVAVPAAAAHRWFALPDRAGLLMTWCGVRGGISVALALSLPSGHERSLVVMLTYSVVVFSILVQGLTVGRVARRLGLVAEARGADEGVPH